MNKKLTSLFLSAALTVTVVSGCSSTQSEATPDAGAVNSPAAGEKTTVEVWYHTHGPLVEWMTAKAAEYNAQHDDVEIVVQDFDSGDMSEKIYTSVAAGMGPAIFDFLDFEHQGLTANDLVAPVDYEAMGYDSKESFESDWYESALAGTKGEDGEYYALPYTSNTWSLFINKELFEKAGLDPETDYPKTWDDMLDVAQKLTIRDSNGTLIQKGFDLPFNQASHWWCYTWGPILAQCGGNIVSDDGTHSIINEPEAVKSLQVLYDLVQKEKVTDPGSVDESEDFRNGKTAMWISGIWSDGTFKGTEVEDKYMAVPLPQMDTENRKTILGGYWWHVSSKVDEKVQEEAWKFLGYLVSDAGDQFAATGLLMPKPEVLECEAWNEYPYHEVFAIDLAAGQWWQGSPYGTEIISVVKETMERSLVGGMDPQEALDMAASEIDTIIQEG